MPQVRRNVRHVIRDIYGMETNMKKFSMKVNLRRVNGKGGYKQGGVGKRK